MATTVPQHRDSGVSETDTAFENVPINNNRAGANIEKGNYDDGKVPFLTARTFFMALLISMGGICFGYVLNHILSMYRTNIDIDTILV